MSDDCGSSWDRVSANLSSELWHSASCAGAYFTDADNETTAPVAIVNEAFVKRFFKTGEDPLDQHFGMDLPENAGTFRIVGVMRDAKFAGFGFAQAGAADVLRASGAECGLQRRDDEKSRVCALISSAESCW